MAARMPSGSAIWAGAKETMFPPDPGRLRLRLSWRATAAGAVTLLIGLAIGQVMPMTPGIEIFGFAATLLIVISVRDDTVEAQKLTTLLSVIPLVVMTLVTAVFSHQPVALDALLVAVIALSLYAPAIGPRWLTFGSIAVTAQLFGLISPVPMSQILERLLILGVSVVVAYLARFGPGGVDPGRDDARVADDLRGVMAAILARAAGFIRAGGPTAEETASLARDILRLEERMAVAQMRLGAKRASRPLADRLLGMEFAIERVIDALGRTPIDQALRPRVAEATAKLAVQVASDGASDGASVAAGAAPPLPGPEPSPQDPLLQRIAYIDRQLRRPLDPPAAYSDDPAGRAAAVRLARRQAVQAALAVAVAIAAGHLISPTRWYWAAFAAFLVFQGTHCRQESTFKAVQIVAGTIAGVLVGVVVGTALTHHHVLAILTSIGAVFLAFQASTAAYGVMVFWFTIIIALVFGLLGYCPVDLLALRFGETVTGVAAGLAVSLLVKLDDRVDALDGLRAANLAALRGLADAAVTTLLGKGKPPLSAPMAEAERSYLALSTAAAPRLSGGLALWSPALREHLVMLRACTHWARELGHVAAGSPPVAREADAIAESAGAVETAIEAVGRTPLAMLRPVGDGRPAPVAIPAPDDNAEGAALVLLANIRSALARCLAQNPADTGSAVGRRS